MIVSVVVPCFNEEKRIDLRSFEGFLSVNPSYKFIFVNDGSTDNTLSVLGELAQKSSSVHILNLEDNAGKAEAVRQGMLYSFSQGVEISGYFDADLATPLAEIPRLVGVLKDEPSIDIVMGSRVNLLGREIRSSCRQRDERKLHLEFVKGPNLEIGGLGLRYASHQGLIQTAYIPTLTDWK